MNTIYFTVNNEMFHKPFISCLFFKGLEASDETWLTLQHSIYYSHLTTIVNIVLQFPVIRTVYCSGVKTRNRILHSEVLDWQHLIYQKSYKWKTQAHICHTSVRNRDLEKTLVTLQRPLRTGGWHLSDSCSQCGCREADQGFHISCKKNNLKVHHSFSGLFVLHFFFFFFLTSSEVIMFWGSFSY